MSDERYLERREVWELLKHYTDRQVSRDCVSSAHELLEGTVERALEKSDKELEEMDKERITGDIFATWWNRS